MSEKRHLCPNSASEKREGIDVTVSKFLGKEWAMDLTNQQKDPEKQN